MKTSVYVHCMLTAKDLTNFRNIILCNIKNSDVYVHIIYFKYSIITLYSFTLHKI